MNGAVSPTGEKHPGEIVHEDKVYGKTWTEKADDMPVTMAWVDLDDAYVAVTKIVITGTPERLRITKYGADDRFLETSVEAPPPMP